jgi:hypothetical protein
LLNRILKKPAPAGFFVFVIFIFGIMDLKQIKRSEECLNCGSALQPSMNYCYTCGQLNNIKKETAAGLLKELVTDFIHFDNKVTGSIVPLIFRPGYLTNEYNSGKRARYLHPVRLFISVTIIMLIVTSIRTVNREADIIFNREADIISADAEINIVDSARFTIGFREREVNYNEIKKLLNSGITDQKQLLDTLHLNNSFYNRFVIGKAVRLGGMSWHEITEYIKHKLPWILFALMPLFAVVLRLIYIRKKNWYVDHLIYSFHLHSATFIIITLNSILSRINESLGGWLLLYIPVYYFLSLHKVYPQSWFKTFISGIGTGVLYTCCALAFSAFAMAALFILI